MPFIAKDRLDRLEAASANLAETTSSLIAHGLGASVSIGLTPERRRIDQDTLRMDLRDLERAAERAYAPATHADIATKARREALELVIEALRLDDYRSPEWFAAINRKIDAERFEQDLKTALRVREEQKQRDVDTKVEEKVAGLVTRSSLPAYKVYLGPAQPIDQPFKIDFNPEAPTVADINRLFEGPAGASCKDACRTLKAAGVPDADTPSAAEAADKIANDPKPSKPKSKKPGKKGAAA